MTAAETFRAQSGFEIDAQEPEKVIKGNPLSPSTPAVGTRSPSLGGEGRGEGVTTPSPHRMGRGLGVRCFSLLRSTRLLQFIKFCFVGGSGVVVDMGLLYLLADPKCLGLNVTLSKIIAAEVAMINNFIWNELWTFRAEGCLKSEILNGESKSKGIFRRFLTFNAICGIGIGFAVLLLSLFHKWLEWHLYLSNFLAIILVTLWNFGLNVHLNWKHSHSLRTI